MDFRNLSHLNNFVNILSGNYLPMTSKKTKLTALHKIYSIVVWSIEFVYLIACILGLSRVPREKALKDGTVNAVVSLEIITLIIYLHCREKLLRGLIEKLNRLIEGNETLQRVTVNVVKPIERPLTIYVIGSITAVIGWIALPLLEIFRKDQFYYSDYRMPAVISNEPFSADIFIAGVALEIVGGTYTIIRKIALDFYTIHFILLMTAQYKYLRVKFATTFESQPEASESSRNNIVKRSENDERTVKLEMKLLTSHYETVVEMALMLRKLLSPNIVILYLNNVFRFCFISFMFVMNTAGFLDGCLIVMYMLGALIQFYILCYSIQELIEASRNVSDDVVHEKWYLHDVSLQREIVMVILTNKLECKLSSLQSINLTLPSFMSVLNQAYSVCLLFLRTKQD